MQENTAPIAIHVGLHKTGTSALQHGLFSSIRGIRYLNSTRRVQSFFAALSSDLPVLISDESISGWPFVGTYREDRYRSLVAVSRRFPDAHVMIGLRKQSALIPSIYRQYLHQGGKADFETFVGWKTDPARVTPTRWFEPNAFRWTELVWDLCQLPFRSILVYDSTQILADPQPLVEFIRSSLNLEDPVCTVSSPPVNVGIKNAAGRLLRSLNRLSSRPEPPRTFERRNRSAKAAMEYLGVTPRTFLQSGLGRFLNHIGTDVVSDQVIHHLSELYASDWKKTTELLGPGGAVTVSRNEGN